MLQTLRSGTARSRPALLQSRWIALESASTASTVAASASPSIEARPSAESSPRPNYRDFVKQGDLIFALTRTGEAFVGIADETPEHAPDNANGETTPTALPPRPTMTLSNGRTFDVNFRDPIFRIPRFVELYAEAMRDKASTGSSRRNEQVDGYVDIMLGNASDSSSISDMLRELNRDSLKMVRGPMRGKLQQLYGALGSRNDGGAFTLDEAEEFVRGKKTSALTPAATLEAETARYALFRFLLESPERFIVFTGSTPDDTRFVCRTPEEMEFHRSLLNYIRGNAQPYRDFLDRCRKAMRRGSQHDATMVDMSQSDRSFVRALVMFSAGDRRLLANQQHPLNSITTAILKELNFQVDRAAMETGKLLIALGVWRPWQQGQTLADISAGRDMWRCMESMERLDRQALEHIQGHLMMSARDLPAAAMASTLDSIETLYDRLGKDTCANRRHDFGDLPCFAVDDYTVKEVDDAISMESDPADPDNPWIHIHVADPTAFMMPTCPLGQLAFDRVTTTYFPGQTLPMIPYEFAHAAASLTPGRANLALTISVKLDARGDISNYNVRPSIIRNLRHVPYDHLADVLEAADTARSPLVMDLASHNGGMWDYPHRFLDGNEPRSLKEKRTAVGPLVSASSSDATFFRQLLTIAERHGRFRETNGAIGICMPRADLHVDFDSKVEMPLPYEVPRAYDRTLLTPSIHLGFDIPEASTSRRMVAEIMVIAGRALGMMARDMRVPVVYRAQPMWDATEPAVAASMHSLTYGLLPPDATLGLLRHMPPSYLTVEPGESHFMLGIDSYAQATSPLRRISDLIAHWQMKAALTGAPPPFDHTNLAFTIQSMRERERSIKRMQRTANEHWMKLFIIEEHHAVKRGERARRVVPAYVFDVTADGYVVFVKDFCLRTFLRGSRAKGTHRVGDWMNVAFRGMDRGFADVEEV